jgi:hypothetical protein
MRKFLVAALLVFAWALKSQAQSRDTKNEIAGTIGRTFISDQTPPNTNFFDNTVHFGKGLSLEADYARRLRSYRWADLSVEVPVILNFDEDLNYGTDQIPEGYRSYFITPAARVNLLPEMVLSPWVSFGGGIGHFSASHNLLFSGTNTGNRGKTTGVIQAGIGFDVHVPKLRSTTFRFEARDDWSGVPPLNIDVGRTRQHNYYVGGGLVFHF